MRSTHPQTGPQQRFFPGWLAPIRTLGDRRHTLTVSVRDRSGSRSPQPLSFPATRSESPGLVRVSPRDPRYFAFESGRPFFPVGANVCWSGKAGTFDYDTWFDRYSQAGCNFARLWLSPFWTPFALERPGKREEGHGMGQFDLGNAWRLDQVLHLATERGIWLKLCIDSFNILRDKDAYPQWPATPHNAALGGPLRQPTDFWTNPAMDRLHRAKLRYLVARYAAFTHLFAWEFWNEVDITTGYQTAPVRDWHIRQSRELRRLDPYRHLNTTSFAGTPGDPEIDALPELDYVQTHHYGSPDLCVTIARAQATKAAFGKPHYVGEIGASGSGSQADPRGLQIHDPIWVSMVSGGPASAQPWFWDHLIHPRNLYSLFTPLVKFTAGIDWPSEQFQPGTPRLDWQKKPDPLPRKDLIIENGPVSWQKTEFNQPRLATPNRALPLLRHPLLAREAVHRGPALAEGICQRGLEAGRGAIER